jgi:hypothetical protein
MSRSTVITNKVEKNPSAIGPAQAYRPRRRNGIRRHAPIRTAMPTPRPHRLVARPGNRRRPTYSGREKTSQAGLKNRRGTRIISCYGTESEPFKRSRLVRCRPAPPVGARAASPCL